MPRPRSEDVTDRVREATAEIVFSDGIGACSVEEVARRSGVAKSSIYRRYASIDELVFDMISHRVTEARPVDTGTLVGDLRVILRRYLTSSRSQNVRELYLWMAQRAQQDPQSSALFEQARIQPAGPTSLAIERAKERGELSPDLDLETAFHLIQGPLFAARLVSNTEPDDEQFERLVTMIVAGLASAS